MAGTTAPLSEQDRQRYNQITKENIEFIMERNNPINRWVYCRYAPQNRLSLPRQKGTGL